jgi:hypothetical protein
MGILDKIRKQGEKPSLYRRAWVESDDPLLAEARAQTLAIQRLETWLRLVYSALALAALLGYWGFAEGGGTVPGVAGVILGIIAFICVIVLRTGIAHGRANVEAMLRELEGRRDTVSS